MNDNIEKGFVVGLLSPILSIKVQNPRLYIANTMELDKFTGGIIRLWIEDVASIRYVRGWEEIEIIKIEDIVEESPAGVKRLVETTSKGKMNIIYTFIQMRTVYAKSKHKYSEDSNRYYYRGFYIDNIMNIGIVTKDGYIPLDKGIGIGNVRIVTHNKRKLIKRGAAYIHNRLVGIMGWVDKVYITEKDLLEDDSEINLGLFIDSLFL